MFGCGDNGRRASTTTWSTRASASATSRTWCPTSPVAPTSNSFMCGYSVYGRCRPAVSGSRARCTSPCRLAPEPPVRSR
ncbi:DUF3551 domain-containing protein [Burkholderia sp. B21-005]|nr:DUF3551 domain-containing protein [Burkholderia sp. B21-007]UEP42973.1 DUF3551 domain-containing protein [Burkholderia sp. B21-005]